MSQTITESDSRLISISDLIQKVRGKVPWTLSIAQRPFEWSPLRVANLVDSILRSFPIGSILVVRMKGAHYKLELSKELRDMENSEETATTQILDGQQRCAAILATFCGKGMTDPKSDSRIWLWINIAAENKRYREFDEERGQKYYLHWSTHQDSEVNGLSRNDRKREDLPPTSPSNGWIPFHLVVDHFRKGKQAADLLKLAELEANTVELLPVLEELKVAVRDALDTKRIPIHRLPDQNAVPQDLHQVFVRINTGGMALSPVDQFFAGVKKYWPDAEEHLRCLTGKGSLFNRRSAITLLARCAANSLKNPFDPYNLGLQDLARGQGKNGNDLIKQMHVLTSDEEPEFQTAVKWVSDLVHSQLYHGASFVPPASLAAVVAWAYRFSKGAHLPGRQEKR